MQSVTDTFSVESYETARRVVGRSLISWKKGYDSTITIFTIGVSAIGGSDVISGDGGVVTEWNKYDYFDESSYLTQMDYQRELNLPLGGVTKGAFGLSLDNTSGRFLPDYMGGVSELFTAILPRRPVILNAGFNYDNADHLLPQFVGINKSNPTIDQRGRSVAMEGFDFIDYLQNRYVDENTMFTAQRSDVVIEDILSQLGFSTSQYELDTGINIIDFGNFDKGARFSDLINQITQAENAHFYQDEEGIIRFENRMKWGTSPYTDVQRIITTGMVINAENLGEDHIINVVEVVSKPRSKQPRQIIFELAAPISVEAGNNDIWVDFEDYVLEADDPIITGGTLQSKAVFAKAAKYVVNAASDGELSEFRILGRPARVREEIYVRAQDDSSVTAYEERPLRIENDYIQSKDWAETYAQMILTDFAEANKLQELTIRAIPELQLGDLISWQGRYWRVYGIETDLSPAAGFVQKLKILQRDVVRYFQIGVSTIGSEDQIAP